MFGVFNVEVLDDCLKLLFVKGFFEVLKLIDFVVEIRFFVNRVVLCKRFRDEDKKFGIVYVYEVGVKSMENRIVIEEKVIFINFFIKLVEEIWLWILLLIFDIIV